MGLDIPLSTFLVILKSIVVKFQAENELSVGKKRKWNKYFRNTKTGINGTYEVGTRI